jgi:hypothetical protein
MMHAAQHSQEREAAICKGELLSFILNKYKLSSKQINLAFKALNRFQNLFANAFVKYYNFGRETTSHLPFEKTDYNKRKKALISLSARMNTSKFC